MADFDSHKQLVLDILRKGYDCGPKAEPFDAKKSWVRLERTAHLFFMQERARQGAMSNAKREARQRAIKAALERARNLIDKAMSDEVGDDLFAAWFEKANLPLASVARNDDGSLHMTKPADEMFEKAVSCLSDLETAAARAADEAHHGRGRPVGARVLPLGYIETLAKQYRVSTGSRPGPDEQPFVDFIYAFLAALGRAMSKDYVVKLIRDAKCWADTHPDECEPSPFSK